MALAVRVWRIDLAKVQYDEADAASLVAAWKFDGHFPIAGTIGSTGLANAPGWSYVLAPGLWLFDSPYAIVATGVAASLLTVALCWWIGRRWLGPWAGLTAAAFYAGGFFPVLLGRTGWQLAFLPPLTLLCLDALLTAAVLRRPWALVVAAGWLGVMFQFHYVTAVHLLMLPLAAWATRRGLRPVHLVALGLALLFGLWPWPLYEASPAVRLRDLIDLVASQGGAPRVDAAVANYLWNLASNAGAVGLGAPNEADLRALFGRWTALAMLGSLLVAAGLVAAVVWWPRGWRGWLIVAWLVVPQIVLARHTLDVLLHYSYPELPVLALSAGLLAGAVAARAPRWPGMRLLVPAAVLMYVASSLGTLFVALTYVDRADSHLGFGIPLRDSLAAGQAARVLVAPGQPVLIAAHHYDGEILRFTLGYDRASTTFDDCTEMRFTGGALYLLVSERSPARGVLDQAGAALLARVPRAGDAYRVYAAPATAPLVDDIARLPAYQSPVCQERRAWGRAI